MHDLPTPESPRRRILNKNSLYMLIEKLITIHRPFFMID